MSSGKRIKYGVHRACFWYDLVVFVNKLNCVICVPAVGPWAMRAPATQLPVVVKVSSRKESTIAWLITGCSWTGPCSSYCSSRAVVRTWARDLQLSKKELRACMNVNNSPTMYTYRHRPRNITRTLQVFPRSQKVTLCDHEKDYYPPSSLLAPLTKQMCYRSAQVPD